jgi:hypothetical protein
MPRVYATRDLDDATANDRKKEKTEAGSLFFV